MTEVHWHIIANLGFKFQSKFTAQAHNVPVLRVAVHAGALWWWCMLGRGEGSSYAMLATARPSCTFLLPAHPGSPEQQAIKRCLCVYVF